MKIIKHKGSENMEKRKIYLVAAIIFFNLFLIFTALVILVDVQPIGPQGSYVGLATMNGAFKDTIGSLSDTDEGYSTLWYNISEIAGFATLFVALGFAILGLCQAIKRKSILSVDKEIVALGSFYVAVFASYLLFEIITINYRPVIMAGELEASYPSSHTMLSLCIMSTAIFEINRLFNGKKSIIILADTVFVTMALTVLVGRLLSGVHWLTDIIAGILISATLICLYRFAILSLSRVKTKKQDKENA